MGVKINNQNVIALRIGNTPIVKRFIGGNVVYQTTHQEVTDYDILAVYNVDDTSSATRILSSINHVEYAYLNDRPIDVAMDYAFAQSGTYTLKVKLQDKIDSVPSYSFKSCKNLVSVDISARLTVLGTEAFYGCTKLTSVTLPDTLTAIYADAFYNCTSLPSIEIPTTVTEIGSSAFENCSNLKSIVIPEGVTTIELDTFNSCHRLRNVVIPSSVTSIGARAFTGCRYLPSIIIPENVTSIGESAFYYCPELIQITCNATTAPILGTRALTSLSNANDGVLYYPCGSDYSSWMTQLNQNPTVWTSECIKGELEYNVTMTCNQTAAIGEIYFLNDLSRVEKMEIDGVEVTPVGNKTFDSGIHTIKVKFIDNSIPSNTLYNINTIDISEDIEVIDTGAFQLTYKLTSVTVSSYNKYYTAQDNCVMELLSGKMIAGVGEFTIPEDVTSIGEGAAWNNDFITNISIPDSVTTIEDGAFGDCSSMLSVTIGSGVTSVGNGVFTRCSKLSSITCNATTAPTINGYLDEFVIYGEFSIAEVGTFNYPCGSDYSTWLAQLPNEWVDGCGDDNNTETPVEYDIDLEFTQLDSNGVNTFRLNGQQIQTDELHYQANLDDIGVTEPITSFNFNGSFISNINRFPSIANVTSLQNAFSYCLSLTKVPALDYPKNLNCNGMFMSTSVGSIARVFPLTAQGMYSYCNKLVSDTTGNLLNNATDLSIFVAACNNLETFEFTSNITPTNLSNFFYGDSKLSTINGIRKVDLTNVTNLSGMFYGCSSLTSWDSVQFTTKPSTALTNASDMFNGIGIDFADLGSLSSHNLNNFFINASNLTNVSGLFANSALGKSYSVYDDSNFNALYWYIEDCSRMFENTTIQYIELGGELSSVTDMSRMFANCSSLVRVTFDSLNLREDVNYSGMFQGCSNLTEIQFRNTPSCTSINILKAALEEAGIKDNVMFNGSMPDCGDSGSGYQVLSFIMSDYASAEYHINGYSQSFSSSNENELYSATTEDMKSMAGNEITSLSFNGGIKQFVSIPSISTLNELEFGFLNVDLIDLSKTNLNNLTKFNLYSCYYLKHIDLSNWASFNVYEYNFFSNCSSLKSVKMLNCCEEAIQFVRDRLSENGINATVITEDNNTYLSLDYNNTPIWYYIGGKAFSTSSRLTDLSGQMDYDSSLGTMFRYSDTLTTVYTMPALSGTTSHNSMFNGCINLKYQDLTTWDFNFIDGSQDISTFFQSCNNLVWVNFSSWDLANAVNYESMFYDCGNLKYVFAYGCNDDTISKLNTAIDNSGSSAELIY